MKFILLAATVLFMNAFGADTVVRMNKVHSVFTKLDHGNSKFAHTLGITGATDKGDIEFKLNSYYATDNVHHFLTTCQNLALEAIRNPAEMGLEIRTDSEGVTSSASCNIDKCQCSLFHK
jgi:hypothetical protein